MTFVKFLLSQYFFWYFILSYLVNCYSNPCKNTIFWKSMMRSFRWIEINCFNKFRFLAEVSTNLQKKHYFGQFEDHNSRTKKENQTDDPIFSFIFWALTISNFHFCILKLAKFIFIGSSFRPFWSAKYLNFGGVTCRIRILSCSIQDTYTLRKVKNQLLLFLSSWVPNLSDLMVYFCLFQNAISYRVEGRFLKF